jgi:hypothetical protein
MSDVLEQFVKNDFLEFELPPFISPLSDVQKNSFTEGYLMAMNNIHYFDKEDPDCVYKIILANVLYINDVQRPENNKRLFELVGLNSFISYNSLLYSELDKILSSKK